MICKNYVVHVGEGSLTVKRGPKSTSKPKPKPNPKPKHNHKIRKDVLSLINNTNVKVGNPNDI